MSFTVKCVSTMGRAIQNLYNGVFYFILFYFVATLCSSVVLSSYYTGINVDFQIILMPEAISCHSGPLDMWRKH